jgi:DNA-binding beta-propeller fold protein YncE
MSRQVDELLAMNRRIDELLCTRENAAERVEAIISRIQSRTEAARQEVTDACQARVDALVARQGELIAKIDEVSQEKVRILREQLGMIEIGTYPPAPPEEYGQPQDPNLFILNADPVINFKVPEEKDFKDKIAEFGAIDEFSTYASNSYAKGPALSACKVLKPTFVWVFACDRVAERRTEGGDQVFVNISVPDDFQDVKVDDMKDGRYKVSFVPLQEGAYQLEIAIGTEESKELIREAPYNITVRQPTLYSEIGSNGTHEGKARVGSTGEPCHPDALGLVHHPSGMAIDDLGRYVIVCDQSNHRVQVFRTDETLAPICSFGRKGFGITDFNTPCGIAVDRHNTIVVSDLLNHRLQVLDLNPRTGELHHRRTIGGKGMGEGQFQFPKGVAVTEHGQLLVCDSDNHRIQVFDMNNKFAFIREIGKKGPENGQFTTPLAICVNWDEELLVSDSLHRIQVFDIEGNFIRSFGTKGKKDGCFKFPTEMVVDDENMLWVCDQENHRVQVLDATDGGAVHTWSGFPKTKTEGEEEGAAEPEEGAPLEWVGIKSPAGLALDPRSGMVLVADYHLNEIFVF